MTQPLEIACDESGNTGPDLLQPEQRYFTYASVQIGDDEARELITRTRKAHPIQMPEFKASKLIKTVNGRAIISDIVDAMNGRFAVCVHDNILAICCQFFEYIYEPVYQDNPWLLYEKKFHRFVAMFCYTWFMVKNKESQKMLFEFQLYMRSLDEKQAPSLLMDLIYR